MRTIPWHSTSTRPSMRWIPPPSIFASRCSLGRRSDPPRPPSSSIHCLICAAIPSFIFISDGKMHDVNILDQLVPEAGAFYVMDRGYLDFERLARLDDAGSFFVTPRQVKPQGSPPLFAP